MSDQDPKNSSVPDISTRDKAPTITIDTAVLSSDGPAARNADDTAASTTAQPTAESQHNDVHESRGSPPSSPLNLTTPNTTRSFLAVPNNLRSRTGSVDSVDASSHGGTTLTPSGASFVSDTKKSTPISNEFIINDKDALKPDAGKEVDFHVENNRFAFVPGELNKMFDPKSLSAYYALGGLVGIAKGLRADTKSGLNPDEIHVEGSVSFEEATAHKATPTHRKPVDAPAVAHEAPSATNHDGTFVERKLTFGDNRLPDKKGKSLLQIMWITYNDKILILLTIAAIVSLAIGLYETFGQDHEPGSPGIEWVEGVAIIAAIAIVVIVGSLNDYQKERQFAKLNRKKSDRLVKVVRGGRMQEISVYDVLVGDVVHLEPGDMVPVDGILIEGFNVKCDESQATGESDIIKKTSGYQVFEAIESNGNLKKLDPFIQSGARIMEGVGTFMCTSTGVYSSYGRTLMSLNEDIEMTPLQGKLNVIATYIAKIGGAAGLLLFITLFIKFLANLPGSDKTPSEKGEQFLDIFIVVVTIIVVAVPEGLPLAVTLALAFATTRMLKDNNLVRHLKACEVMGNATAICSDKTGTLTQNKMQVVAATIGTSSRFGKDDNSEILPQTFASSLSEPVKKLLVDSFALNSTAFEGEVEGKPGFIGSKTETALLILGRDYFGMGDVAQERDNAKVLQIIPFDSGRKCMGAIVQTPSGGARLLIKGASEIVLGQCTQLLRNPTSDLSLQPMTSAINKEFMAVIDGYANRSLRTIGIAYRDFASWPAEGLRRNEDDNDIRFDDLFQQMTFLGVVGIQDPLRPGVPEAVALCQKAGVTVRMVTGDNRITAAAIARECGILEGEGLVLEGPEFRNMSKEKQNEIIPRLRVLARSSPEDKRVLVKRLKGKGEIVAVTGDGTNDAPALKTADVGFSMGIAGTEVAKEASAIILMDDNFTSIINALKWGRAVNDAVKRFLQFQLTVNITAVLLTFISAVASDEEASVLTAVQLLWVNLIMDTLAALALATDPPHDSILDRKPEPRNAFIISLTMWKMILGQAVYQLVVTLVLYFGRNSVLPSITPKYTHDEVSTLVFNTFVWMQIFNQWNNRRLDNGYNILEGVTKNPLFLGINVAMCGLQVLIVFVAGPVFNINDPRDGNGKDPQGGALWGIAIGLGFLSIPFGMLIRTIPDAWLAAVVPQFIKNRASRAPGLTVSDEETFQQFPPEYQDVRDELEFIKKVKGGRLTNLKFAIAHPRQRFAHSRNSSRSRMSSATVTQVQSEMTSPPPATQQAAASKSGTAAGENAAVPSPETSHRLRARTNSTLGAPSVMAGIVAAGIATSWQAGDRKATDGEEN
ncbi:plasma membrane calcium [Ceratocystis pirilliformis]|uniref:Calcium-transporting ATPase n=1 Tax=Ceratocystis pirilliformis TaxID=259994 RepID=A0ABR3ZDF8_9PEZI